MRAEVKIIEVRRNYLDSALSRSWRVLPGNEHTIYFSESIKYFFGNAHDF